jgi:CelD/BcsL family acetyltransferase involved in cellulose biosynthesis
VEGMASLRSGDGVMTFVGDKNVCDYNDFLVPRGQEEGFYRELVEGLSDLEWKTLDLYSLNHASPTLEYLPEIARSKGYRVEVVQDEVCPGKELPKTWDEYLSSLSKKNRHELRRKLRRLDTAPGMKWYVLRSWEEIGGAMDDFFSLLKMSRETKHRFLTPEREKFFRCISKETAEMDVMRLYFMEVESKRVAAALCFDYGTSRFLYNSGYNQEYGYYSVGLLLKAFTVKDAIEEGKEYYDFLRGNEPYKYDLGGEDKPLYRMTVTRE